MKPRLSIWTVLIAGYLLSAPGTRAGQIPLKNEPLERETSQNLNMKRYVAAGDRAYVVGVQNGSLVPDPSLNMKRNRLAHYRANGWRVGTPD